MKFKIIILLISVGMHQSAFGQSDSATPLPTFNFFDDAEYTITGFKYKEEMKFRYDLLVKGESKSFTLYTNTLDAFTKEFIKAVKVAPEGFTIEQEAKRIYFIFLSASKTIGDLDLRPRAGTVFLNSDVLIQRNLNTDPIAKGKIEAQLAKYKKGGLRLKIYEVPFDTVRQGKGGEQKLETGKEQTSNNETKNNPSDTEAVTPTPMEAAADTAVGVKNSSGASGDNDKKLAADNEQKSNNVTENSKAAANTPKGVIDSRVASDDNDKRLFIKMNRRDAIEELTNRFQEKVYESVKNDINTFLTDYNKIIENDEEIKKELNKNKDKQESGVKLLDSINGQIDSKQTEKSSMVIQKQWISKGEDSVRSEYDQTQKDYEKKIIELQGAVKTITEKKDLIDPFISPNDTVTTPNSKKAIKVISELLKSRPNENIDEDVSKASLADLNKWINRLQEDLSIQSAEYKIDIQSKSDEIEATEDALNKHKVKFQDYLRWEPLDGEISALEIELEVKKFDLKTLKDQENDMKYSLKENSIIKEQIIDRLHAQINKLPIQKFRIDSVQFEFKDGYIEHMKVVGNTILFAPGISRLPDELLNRIGKHLKFENTYPLGFSRKRDFQFLVSSRNRKHKLVAVTGSNSLSNGNYKDELFTLNTYEFIKNYIQEHQEGRRDFGPENGVVSYSFDDDEKVISRQLYKEATSKIIEVKVYSDFLGFQQENQNGLVQLELSKKLNIRTDRSPIHTFRQFPRPIWANFGFVSYVVPNLALTKIEETNKQLPISYRDDFQASNAYSPSKYMTTLDLRRYETFSTGLDLNIFMFNQPNFKSNFYFDIGFRYAQLQVVDSLRNFDGISVSKTEDTETYNLNTLRVTPFKVTWDLQTDERYQFDFNWSYNKLYLRDNRFEQVGSSESFLQGKSPKDRDRGYFMTELNAQFNGLSDSGKLFFRYRYFWQNGYWNTGFHQAQVGYTFFLTRSLNVPTKP